MQKLAVNFGPQTRFTDAEFDRLFLDHYSQITAAAYRLVGDPDEAEELAAETFWKLWQKPPVSQENILGWLYRVVINLGYNRLRSFKRRGKYEEGAFTDTHLTSSPANPQDELERKQERLRVRAALAQLPERDVQVLLLHALGSSYQEIATALALKPNSVGTTLARAEQKFERIYAKGDPYAPQR
jgi:RNA polymerase sigma factor (sigma-70 family)